MSRYRYLLVSVHTDRYTSRVIVNRALKCDKYLQHCWRHVYLDYVIYYNKTNVYINKIDLFIYINLRLPIISFLPVYFSFFRFLFEVCWGVQRLEVSVSTTSFPLLRRSLVSHLQLNCWWHCKTEGLWNFCQIDSVNVEYSLQMMRIVCSQITLECFLSRLVQEIVFRY